MIMFSSNVKERKAIILTTVLVLISGHLLMTCLLQVLRLLVIKIYVRYETSFYDAYFNGTSAAAPVVTGVVAQFLQDSPVHLLKMLETG